MDLERFNKPRKVLIQDKHQRWAIARLDNKILYIRAWTWKDYENALKEFQTIKIQNDKFFLKYGLHSDVYKLIEIDRINRVEE